MDIGRATLVLSHSANEVTVLATILRHSYDGTKALFRSAELPWSSVPLQEAISFLSLFVPKRIKRKVIK